jgi:DNA polymerase I-like protein with 3'-5' exonuclease and polymerase domains
MKEVNKDAHKTGVSIDFGEAKKYIETYRRLHPGLERWWNDTERQLYETATLYNLLGRKRVFYGCRRTGNGTVSDLPNAVAFVPQSTIGDTLNVGLLQLSGTECHYGRKMGIVERIPRYMDQLREAEFMLLMQIHDAVAFQYRVGFRDQVCEAVRQLMRVPLVSPKTREVFEIPVEIQVGPNWGDVKLWKKVA